MLFEVTRPQVRNDAWAKLMLALITAAGAAVRFWGLGSVGLHGDEKTMALPVMSIVEHGAPLMPSGMFYARGLAQLYLMAGSVMAFGQSEWALRLPSVICGVGLIPLAWLMGRRFLTPAWNLAFTAAVAFLPDFIDDAQTARMYVFLVTSVAGFLVLLFEWERTGRAGFLVAAVAVLLAGIQFHTLAVFAAFLVFFPGVLHGDQRKFWLGALAFAVIIGCFAAINSWIGSFYPQSIGPDEVLGNGPRAGAAIPHLARLWLAVAAPGSVVVAMLIVRRHERASTSGTVLTPVIATALLAAGLTAQFALHYHLAALLIVAGLVVARRNEQLSVRGAGLLLAVSVLVAAAQTAYLFTHAAASPRQIIGAMLGWPSVWPYLAIAQYSVAAAVLVAAGIAVGLWRLAHREPIPDHLLLVVLGAWIPLLIIGLMRWDIPPRYAEGQVMPLLLGAFASARWLLGLTLPGLEPLELGREGGSRAAPIAAAVAGLLVINPPRLAQVIDSGYADHPDHRGAAEFIASVHPGPHDVLVAEDVLQQTYYLGHVDFWLVNKQIAAPFMHEVNGKPLDFYTNTPLLGTGPELQKLIDKPDRGAIYVIGSGENQSDGRRLMRGSGIYEMLQSSRFQVVYRGRDGLTEIWKVPAPVQAADAARK